jgi:hypothetical protein
MKPKPIRMIKKENIFKNKPNIKKSNFQNLNIIDIDLSGSNRSNSRMKALSPNPRQKSKFEIPSRAKRGRKLSNNKKVKIDPQALEGARFFSPQNRKTPLNQYCNTLEQQYNNEGSQESIHHDLQNTHEKTSGYRYQIETKEVPVDTIGDSCKTQQNKPPTNFQKIGTVIQK